MRLVIIREHDGETFDLGAYVHGSYVLDKSAVIPGGTQLDVSGYEYSGRDGGYQTSSRRQRRTFTIPFAIREDHTTTSGLFELIRSASAFFIPHNENLQSYRYSIEFYTEDRTESLFQLRHGTISVPLNIKTQEEESRADAQISFIFGDPYLYSLTDSGISFTIYPGGQNPGTPDGRMWDDTDGATWDVSDGKLWETAGGSGDSVTVNVDTIATVPVSIITSGQLTDPQIVNLTNGSSFFYDGTLGSGDVLTIDTAGVVLVNGAAPGNTYSGTLTASNGSNTFVMLAPPGSPGYATLTILGAF